MDLHSNLKIFQDNIQFYRLSNFPVSTVSPTDGQKQYISDKANIKVIAIIKLPIEELFLFETHCFVMEHT